MVGLVFGSRRAVGVFSSLHISATKESRVEAQNEARERKEKVNLRDAKRRRFLGDRRSASFPRSLSFSASRFVSLFPSTRDSVRPPSLPPRMVDVESLSF